MAAVLTTMFTGAVKSGAEQAVSLNSASRLISVGGYYALKVWELDQIFINKTTFTSSNKAVATVDKEGGIRGKKAGKAVILVKVKYQKGEKITTRTLKCNVIVNNNNNVDSIYKALNKKEAAALKKLIAKQESLGVKGISEVNFYSEEDEYSTLYGRYEWDNKGHLTKISWDDRSINLVGNISFSKFPKLKTLYCRGNKLLSIDIRKNKALTNLGVIGSKLTSLDVSKNTALRDLSCYHNKLTSLNLSKNTALRQLWCGYNKLTNLDVSKCTALYSLSCSNNKLTSLNLSKNTALSYLDCDKKVKVTGYDKENNY